MQISAALINAQKRRHNGAQKTKSPHGAGRGTLIFELDVVDLTENTIHANRILRVPMSQSEAEQHLAFSAAIQMLEAEASTFPRIIPVSTR
ncbi:hypothetical protein [Paracidovorax citrulli]